MGPKDFMDLRRPLLSRNEGASQSWRRPKIRAWRSSRIARALHQTCWLVASTQGVVTVTFDTVAVASDPLRWLVSGIPT